MGKKKKFDKVNELKYITLWLGIPVSTIILLKTFGINDIVTIALSVIIAVLLVQNYLKDKEIESLK